MKKRLIRWAILLAIGFSTGLSIGYFQEKSEITNDKIALSPDDVVQDSGDLVTKQ